MGFMDISGQGNNYPILPIGVPAGGAFILPAGQGIVGGFGGVVSPQIGSNNPLSGQYLLQMGQYTSLQMFDYGMNYWQDVAVAPSGLITISSDGANFRVVNSTGCPIGAVITNAGSGYTNGFYGYSQFGSGQGSAITIQNGFTTAGQTYLTITPSAGGSLWNAIIGGAINTTISSSGTVFNGNLASQNSGAGQSLFAFGQTSAAGGITASAGSNYTKPPIIVFTPPVNQGQQPYILPTATCTISGGAINAITVVDQGAGLMSLPGIVVIPQPGDTTGGGAVLGWLYTNTGTAGLGAGTGSGSILAMWPAYYGTALTAVPTFTFSPASTTAATAVMNFSITSITNTTAGVGYTNAYAVWQGGVVSATAATNVSPRYGTIMSQPIFPAVSVIAATGVSTLYAGAFQGVNIQAVPTLAFGTQLAAGTVTTVAVQTPVVGGVNDVVKLQTF